MRQNNHRPAKGGSPTAPAGTALPRRIADAGAQTLVDPARRWAARQLARLAWVAQRLFGLLVDDEQTRRVARWRADGGDVAHRFSYPFGPAAVVLDVGGFRGDWAAEVAARFGCTIHVFEPVPEFAAAIADRFAANPRVNVHAFGLADVDGSMAMDVDEDRSSVLAAKGGVQGQRVMRIRDVAAVWDELSLGRVDLLKSNIEGGEYSLLARLAETGLLRRIDHVQVQFHDFVEDADRRVAEARRQLSVDHRRTWGYDWVWESWSRR